jgi:hypothetical protein
MIKLIQKVWYQRSDITTVTKYEHIVFKPLELLWRRSLKKNYRSRLEMPYCTIGRA